MCLLLLQSGADLSIIQYKRTALIQRQKQGFKSGAGPLLNSLYEGSMSLYTYRMSVQAAYYEPYLRSLLGSNF